MTRRALAALLLFVPALAWTQTAAVPCAPIDHLPPARLSGLWQLSLWPDTGAETSPASTGALLLETHPEFAGSVRGELKRSAPGNDRTAVVSGDVVDGEFHLEESADGRTMDAVWSGTPLDCGLTIRGTRRPAEGRLTDEPVLNFLLKKAPGWR